jgi:alkylated DNA repair protein (DNA oxidative demethylase)
MTLDPFGTHELSPPGREEVLPGVVMLRGRALALDAALVAAAEGVTALSPFRHMMTPGGFTMSVAMSNCGEWGWVTDRTGYRYDRLDPQTNKTWPVMPAIFRTLATDSAAEAGFADFTPDACLINRYEPGARMSLHQDRNERDFSQPIVSVSLGLPAVFQFGGDKRSDKTLRVPLTHGDVIVWGGPARLRFHAILPLKPGHHPLLGAQRLNLTFRRAN